MQQHSQPFDFSGLTVEQRIELAMALWDSVHDEVEKMPLTKAQEEELERRLAEERAGRVTYSTWDEVKARIFSK